MQDGEFKRLGGEYCQRRGGSRKQEVCGTSTGENDLVVEFKEFLEDPVQQLWVQAYLDGDREAKTLVKVALKTLEESHG